MKKTKKCSACGQEMSVYASKCPNCGTVPELKRNGFVSFWLWFCTVVNSLCFIGYFFLLFSSKGLWGATPEPVWLKLAWIIGSGLNVLGFVVLLKWNKTGFYLLSGICVLNIVMSIIAYGIDFSAFQSVIPLVILYAVLNIKKDALTYWEAMDMKREKQDTAFK